MTHQDGSKATNLWVQYRVDIGLAVAVTAVFMYVRRDYILARVVLNPDEAELLAAGKRAAMSFIPFKDFTVPTYGPAWPLFLGTIHRLGMPLTVPVAHLSSTLAAATCCAAVAVGFRRSAGWVWLLAIAVPLTVHWSFGFYNLDFLAMATETLPVCFLALACAVGFGRTTVSQRRAVATAVLFGFVVSSKYFFAPVVLVGLAALIVLLSRSGVSPSRSVVVVGTAFVAPFVLTATLAVAFGVPWWKVSETIVFNWNYARGGGTTGPIGLTVAQRLDVAWNVVANMPSVSLAAAAVFVLLVARLVRASGRPRGNGTALLAFAAAGIVVSLLMLYAVYPVHPHYAYIFVAGVLQAVLVCRTALPRLDARAFSSNLGRATAFVAGAFIAAMVLLVPTQVRKYPAPATWRTSWSKIFSPEGGLMARMAPAVPGDAAIESLCPRGSRVLVWGWEPGSYSYYDWQPASRYVVTTYQIDPNRIAADPLVYRPRLAEELVARPPDCIVEAAPLFAWRMMGDAASMTVQMPEVFGQMKRKYADHQMMWDAVTPITVHVGQ